MDFEDDYPIEDEKYHPIDLYDIDDDDYSKITFRDDDSY